MPLPWVRLDTTLPSNPKILTLLADKDGHRAAFVYTCSLAYAGSHGTDGYIPGAALPFIHCRQVDASRLVKHRLWWEKDGGWVINGWHEFQQSTEETQERARRAQEASRKANCVRWHGEECGCWRISG